MSSWLCTWCQTTRGETPRSSAVSSKSAELTTPVPPRRSLSAAPGASSSAANARSTLCRSP
jgi:hypothetical protein